jgi:two-component system chemotaxis response regulator CheB
MIRAVVAAGSSDVSNRVVEALANDPDISVVAVAATGWEVVEATKRLKPDIVILGIRLPVQDGFDAIKQIMIEAPTPIAVIADAEDSRQVEISMRALRAGALTVLAIPSREAGAASDFERRTFASDIKAMSQVKVVRHWRRPAGGDDSVRRGAAANAHKIGLVAIAASTGGPAALQRILCELPADFPSPILVVQHITTGFIDGFGEWLHTSCPLTIKSAVDGEPLRPHTVYLAGDGRHLGVSAKSTILLSDAPQIGGFKPSANFLFESVATTFGDRAIGVILTGMGRDGVDGLKKLHGMGGRVIAQDEASSIVYGMPGTAAAAGVVSEILPLTKIAAKLISLVIGED